MKLSRRSLIKAGAVASLAATGTARAMAGTSPALVIYDSRLPESRAFAALVSAPRIDVAHEDARFWKSLREAAPKGRIAGLTRWSDLVVVRGYLEEQGRRITTETRQGLLFRWDMG